MLQISAYVVRLVEQQRYSCFVRVGIYGIDHPLSGEVESLRRAG
ncbi:hypothetical protein SDC9_130623 [bioreactor metagenome]|uniref:Uncharacterized protein n=1 Tax=bioreactor metagenome TaxID=1076179 RepID=A0A645D2X9_9ZZZZ